MKYYGEAAAFKQFTNSNGVTFYPIDKGTWYGKTQEGPYIKRLVKDKTEEYVTVKFSELDSYLKNCKKNSSI